jgi:hypothetical protein
MDRSRKPAMSACLRAVEKVKVKRAEATLVVSWWDRSQLWPGINCDLVEHTNSLVVAHRHIPAGHVPSWHTSILSTFTEMPWFWTLALCSTYAPENVKSAKVIYKYNHLQRNIRDQQRKRYSGHVRCQSTTNEVFLVVRH